MNRRVVLGFAAASVALALTASPALATIHPLVESYDCANEQAFEHHPLGDPADPPGQTPGVTPGNGNNALRALRAVTNNFTDWTSPSLFGHKLNGQCGPAGP